MTTEDVGTFADLRDDLLNGSLSDESETEDNQPAPADTAPTGMESPASEDKQASDPAATETTKEERRPAEAAEPAAEASEKGEQSDATDDDDPEIDVGEEKVRLSVLKQGYARRMQIEKDLQAAATRKFQEASQVRSEADKRVKDTVELVAAIGNDKDMREFVRAHPEALAYLIQQPAETRKLLGNSQAITEFWEDYETLQANPRLAERFAQGDEQASEALKAEQTQRHVQWIADSLDNAVRLVSQSYPDVPTEQVEDYLLELGGMTRESDKAAVQRGMLRLYNLLFVQTEEGVKIDGKLIRDRFEYLATVAKQDAAREARAAEKHNAEVDAELARAKDAPPATPAGSVPAAQPEKTKAYDGFEDAIQDMLYG